MEIFIHRIRRNADESDSESMWTPEHLQRSWEQKWWSWEELLSIIFILFVTLFRIQIPGREHLIERSNFPQINPSQFYYIKAPKTISYKENQDAGTKEEKKIIEWSKSVITLRPDFQWNRIERLVVDLQNIYKNLVYHFKSVRIGKIVQWIVLK